MASNPSFNFNLFGTLSESKRIINAHSRHFLALSVLFLLPLSFSFIIYPTLQTILSQSISIHKSQIFLYTLFDYDHNNRNDTQSLIIPLLYTVFVLMFSLCATATITYSTFHGFYGRPVKLISALKSLLYSFIPLLVTTIIAEVVVLLIIATFGIFIGLVKSGIEMFRGYEIDYNSSYFIGFCVLVASVLGLVLFWLQVNWVLWPVIVVVESKWGYEPLRRSAYLVKGLRWISLWLLLFFGTVIGFFVWGSSKPLANFGGFGDWRSWVFVFQTVVGSSFVTLLMLHNVAANTVLYMYCKALRGELAFEIAEEFAREYVSLPFDDEKVPHVVSVVRG